MAHHPILDKYLNESFNNGMSEEEITRELLAVGWQLHHFVDFFGDHGHESAENIILVRNLSKSFGNFKALDNIDFDVKRGSVTALLGPNGAGKTTLIRILTTLLKGDQGQIKVGGLDVERDAQKLRSLLGLAGQFAAVDEILSGRQNLEMVGRLYHMGYTQSKIRAEELLRQFGLSEAADRQVKTYSGGMKRRLDLAASLVAKPRILFLDEPTNGLDPRSRFDLWHIIRDLVQDGTTVLLTTQYLEEADQLANQVYVIDHGKIIAKGTSDELKLKVGGDVAELHLESNTDMENAEKIIEHLGKGPAHANPDTSILTMPIEGGAAAFLKIVKQLDTAGIKVRDFSLRRPSLDDVFLKLTGQETKQNQN